jgi:hypothetical protein
VPELNDSAVLQPFRWSADRLRAVTRAIYAAHITSLRTQMDAALSALGMPLTPYADPQTLTFIKAVHFTDLQARIR